MVSQCLLHTQIPAPPLLTEYCVPPGNDNTTVAVQYISPSIAHLFCLVPTLWCLLLICAFLMNCFCLFYNHAKVSAFYRSSGVQGFLHYKFTVLHFSAPITFYFSATDDARFTFSYLLLQHIFYVFRSVHVHDIICTSNKKCIYSA